MKKWHIVSLAAIAGTILLIAIGVFAYRMIILPRYIEPIVDKFSETVHDESVLNELYEQAVTLHNEGVLNDSVYSSFIAAYTKYMRDDDELIREILEDDKDNDRTSNALTARYASSRVGIEMIQVNDGESTGKSADKYSLERSSNRTRAEDIIEAEKILEKSGEEDTQTAAEDDETVEDEEESAYAKLREHMTASEYAKFISIASKLNINIMRQFASSYDKEGLKEYLHANLSESEYHDIVNIGYKYAYLFLE